MTTNNPNFWQQRSGAYTQPTVLNPASGQNPNNARMAVWHLGGPFTLEVFPTGDWQVGNDDLVDNGRYNRGISELITVYGHIQPLTHNSRDGSQDMGTRRGGEYVEGEVMVHLDSHQPENITAAALSTFFNDHIFLSTTEHVPAGFSNFAMVVHWRGRKWKILTVQEHAEGSDEEVSGTSGAIYRARCDEWTDVNQEKLAVTDDATTFFGPESP